MQLPILAPAPRVVSHAKAFRDLFENRCQYRHFENDLTGRMVLPNKSRANMRRCTVKSADKTNLSRYFSADRWEQEEINVRRVKYVLQQTKAVRLAKERSARILDDTLCEPVGSLFEYMDHPYNQGDNTYPLAHHAITRHYVSGPVRFPVDVRLYRRYEEVTRWEELCTSIFLGERSRSRNSKKQANPNEGISSIWARTIRLENQTRPLKFAQKVLYAVIELIINAKPEITKVVISDSCIVLPLDFKSA